MEDQLWQIIRQLRVEVARLERRVAELEEENRQIRQELEGTRKQLEQERAKNARQAAPFRRREKKRIPDAEKKRPGRQGGHPGVCRVVPDHVDQDVEVPLEGCPRCGGPVKDVTRLVQYIEEIPPVRPLVTKLVTYEGECAQCGPVCSTHPLKTSHAGGAAKVQLGPRSQAIAASLNKHHGLTLRRVCKVLASLCGLKVTPGGLSQALDRAAQKVEPLYHGLVDQLRRSQAVHADETSWWVGGPGWWLWTFTDPQTTVYRVDGSRGSEVVKETLGENFPGVLVSDCLASYDPIDCRKHKCIAHHQRAIAKARDAPQMKDLSYLDQWRLLFEAVSALWKARPAMNGEAFGQERARIEAWCQRLLNQPVTQPGDVAVQNRLLKQWPHLLTCLDEPAAEPTNNRAERALRPAVIARKLSCGNKTPRGARTWETLTSLAATCHGRAIDFIDYLAAHLPLQPAAG